MLKMLATQLTGTFQRINEKETLHIEDAARSLAQAIVGEGHVYVWGTGEMKSLIHEVEEGPETLPKQHVYHEDISLSSIDRVMIASRFADDEEALALVNTVQKHGAQVIQISALTKEENPLQEVADFHIDTKTAGPLLPFDMDRIGFPSVIAMFYVYMAIYVTTKEIIDEYE